MPAEFRCIPTHLRTLAVCAGVGEQSAVVAAKTLVERGASVLVSMGVAGALHQDLAVGAALNIHEVVELGSGESFSCQPIIDCSERHRLVSAKQAVTRTISKQNIAQQYLAHAVDMESAAIARVAYEQGIPFCCARTISDDMQRDLPREVLPLLDGGQSPLILVKSLLKRPSLIVELIYLAHNYRKALRQLKKLAAELDTLISAALAKREL